jgi:hypothetical protein
MPFYFVAIISLEQAPLSNYRRIPRLIKRVNIVFASTGGNGMEWNVCGSETITKCHMTTLGV